MLKSTSSPARGECGKGLGRRKNDMRSAKAVETIVALNNLFENKGRGTHW